VADEDLELRPRFERRAHRILDHRVIREQGHDRVTVTGIEAVYIGLQCGLHFGLAGHILSNRHCEERSDAAIQSLSPNSTA
jgi:hypothetical protein